jgi:hypothetical protein
MREIINIYVTGTGFKDLKRVYVAAIRVQWCVVKTGMEIRVL